MLDKILVPLDGSVTAEAILPCLRRLLRRRDSELILLRAADVSLAEMPPSAVDSVLGAAREYIQGKKERLEQDGVRVRAEARLGPAAGTILEVARKEGVSLIAMATHGRSGLARALFGSVAEHVVLKTPVPVLVVRPFWSPELVPPAGQEGEPIRSILLPLDRSQVSLAVRGPALELAKLFGARLVLLHVEEPRSKAKPESDPGESLTPLEWLETVAQSAKAEGIETFTVVDQGEVVEAILQNARNHGCDLIAMTTHGRSGIGRLVVGSVTEKVLRNATLPLLVVRAVKEKRKKAYRASAQAKIQGPA